MAEADHRIANHLSLLSSYVRLRSAQFEGAGMTNHAAVRLLTQSIDAQIRGVAKLHRMMTLQSGAGAANLSLLLHEICAPFMGMEEDRVALVEDIEPSCQIDFHYALSVSQLVGEAITNAWKHAFPGSRTGVLLVQLRRDGADTLCVEIIDNGAGLPEAFDPESDGGFGFNLMRSISRGIPGQLRFVSGPEGLRVSLTLPSA